MSLGTLRSRMFHALRRLRQILQAKGGDQGENLI
jgi:DNA-directed RNA polymerase specialized sigma24 family protein